MNTIRKMIKGMCGILNSKPPAPRQAADKSGVRAEGKDQQQQIWGSEGFVEYIMLHPLGLPHTIFQQKNKEITKPANLRALRRACRDPLGLHSGFGPLP
jgi:hypothetical protein